MRRLFIIFALSFPTIAQTIPITPNLGLQLIPDGYKNWGVPYRTTMTTIDTWSATVAIRNNPVFTGIVTFPITGSTQCLHVNSTGIVSGTGVDCGSGSGAITHVFGRVGDIVAVSGDYTAAQVTNAASLANAGQQNFSGAIKVPALLLGTNLATSYSGDSQSIVVQADNGVIPIVPGHLLSWIPDTAGGGSGAGDSGKTVPTGAIVGTTDTQTITNKTIDGVPPATMAFVDPTSSIQTQLNSKSPSASPTFTGTTTFSGSGIPIATGTTSNTDLAGSITLAGGSGTYTLAATYLTAPIVVCSDTTAVAAVKCTATTTVVTATGTGTDVINYIIIGRT